MRVREADLRELMDDPRCDERMLLRTVRRFGLVNRAVSGWGAIYRSRLRPYLRSRADELREAPVRILDVGCGGGDVTLTLARRARADGFAVEVCGIDPDTRCLSVARSRPSEPGVTFRGAYAADLVEAGEEFDVVVSNHVLHHLSRDQLHELFAHTDALGAELALHNDIARSRTAWGLYSLGILPFAPGTFLFTDGLRSIRRSYTLAELQREIPPGWTVTSPAPFRVIATRSSRTTGGV
ncbi:class I SAM-dependent methyltransferase [Microbacterium schleiferi]|uniref:methyltransferase domain-containing protein n=1 Tax=Microbacterium sp. F2 TaxID=3422228 RepID=UPI0033756915